MVASSTRSAIHIAAGFIISTSLSYAFTAPAAYRSLYQSTALCSSLSEDSQSPRPSLASSEEQLNDIDLPPRTSSSETSNIYSNGDEPRSSEFRNLEPLQQSSIRTTRLETEAKASSIYIPSASNEYWSLLEEIDELESDLQSGLDVGISDDATHSILSMIRRKKAQDPDHVYQITKEAAKSAARIGRLEESKKYQEEAERARNMLPQFNLGGLWVGKYGAHGFEMINVTYTDDTLVAYKVTGDQNIPRGEITFTADFQVDAPGYGTGNQPLEPIVLSENSAKKWGTKKLPRFPGQGHAAEPGYVNNQFMEGQLVVIGEKADYFSFAWVPLEHQIFFGRPSPELTLKMLREGGGSALTAGTGMDVPSLDADVKEQTEYVSRCLEVTCDTMFDQHNEGKVAPESCIWHGDNDEHCYFE